MTVIFVAFYLLNSGVEGNFDLISVVTPTTVNRSRCIASNLTRFTGKCLHYPGCVNCGGVASHHIHSPPRLLSCFQNDCPALASFSFQNSRPMCLIFSLSCPRSSLHLLEAAGKCIFTGRPSQGVSEKVKRAHFTMFFIFCKVGQFAV